MQIVVLHSVLNVKKVVFINFAFKCGYVGDVVLTCYISETKYIMINVA